MSSPTAEISPPESSPTAAPEQRPVRALPVAPAQGWRFLTWYWALVPLLAVAAYATVVRVNFLSDDFMQLYTGRETGVSLPHLLPSGQVGFYRPVGVLLIWQMGWQLWGFNPAPYHAVQLLLHAANSLILGLWLAGITRRPWMGWLAGALFAVFPLHTEAVGFIGAQFDSYSVLFGLLSLWCFTSFWGRKSKVGGLASRPAAARTSALYLAAFLFYSLAVMTKESLFLFIPVIAAAAWYVSPPAGWRGWGRMGLALLPFALPIAANLALRYTRWGTVGGYGGTRSDYASFIWDSLATCVRLLLSPLNPVVVGVTWAQAVGMLATIALLVGLVLYGSEHRRLLLLAGIWIFVTLVPVLNIPPRTDDLQGNRYLYMTSAGYMVGVSALLYSAMSQARRLRGGMAGTLGLVMLLSIVACWVQLRPWQTASAQVQGIIDGLLSLIPAQPRPQGMVWYVEDVPSRYKGVPVLLSGLGLSRTFTNGGIDYPRIERVEDAEAAPIEQEERDAFRLRFAYNESRDRFDIDYLAGITADGPPPSGELAGDNLQVWDFTSCAPDVVQSWQAVGARPACEQGKGLLVQNAGVDPQLLGPELPPRGPVSINPADAGAEFVRLRVAVSYQEDPSAGELVNEWFWHGPSDGWSAERARRLPIKRDGSPHVYWTFIPAAEAGESMTRLRFDPANGDVPATIRWIAVDVVR
jgi:hypothetical protein